MLVTSEMMGEMRGASISERDTLSYSQENVVFIDSNFSAQVNIKWLLQMLSSGNITQSTWGVNQVKQALKHLFKLMSSWKNHMHMIQILWNVRHEQDISANKIKSIDDDLELAVMLATIIRSSGEHVSMLGSLERNLFLWI